MNLKILKIGIVGFIAGVLTLAAILALSTGLRIDKIFGLGKALRESNEFFLTDYTLSETKSAVALELFETHRDDSLREHLWGGARRLYWDEVLDRPRNELERRHGKHFAEIVGKSAALMKLADSERKLYTQKAESESGPRE